MIKKMEGCDSLLLLCHKHADADSIASAFSLSEYFNHVIPDLKVSIGVMEDVNRIGGMLIERLEIEVIIDPDPTEYGFVLVLDTATYPQIGFIPLTRYGVIDHHTKNDLLKKAEWRFHRVAESTSQLIYDLLNRQRYMISNKIGFALVAGIVTDTGHLRHASTGLFKTLYTILKRSKVEYWEVIEFLSSAPQDYQKRIGCLKAATKMNIFQMEKWILVTSEVDDYGGSIANMLLNIGADVVFTSKENNGLVKINARAKKEIIQNGLNLGDILHRIGMIFKGAGGGHIGAGGADVKGNSNDILNYCIELTKAEIT